MTIRVRRKSHAVVSNAGLIAARNPRARWRQNVYRTENLHHNWLRSAHLGNFGQTQHPLENVLSRRVFDLADSDRVSYVEPAGFRPAKRFQMRAATERFADVVNVGADIKAFAAQHA